VQVYGGVFVTGKGFPLVFMSRRVEGPRYTDHGGAGVIFSGETRPSS